MHHRSGSTFISLPKTDFFIISLNSFHLSLIILFSSHLLVYFSSPLLFLFKYFNKWMDISFEDLIIRDCVQIRIFLKFLCVVRNFSFFFFLFSLSHLRFFQTVYENDFDILFKKNKNIVSLYAIQMTKMTNFK